MPVLRTDDMTDQDQIIGEAGRSVKRAEWGVMFSIAISVLTAIFTLGVMYGDVQRNVARITVLEVKTASMEQAVTRIDQNVIFLADRAREDRAADAESRRRGN
jgi:hypothetical protein